MVKLKPILNRNLCFAIRCCSEYRPTSIWNAKLRFEPKNTNLNTPPSKWTWGWKMQSAPPLPKAAGKRVVQANLEMELIQTTQLNR